MLVHSTLRVWSHFLLLLTQARPLVAQQCIEAEGDPWWSGTEQSCCPGLKTCLRASVGWQYRCQLCNVACSDDDAYSDRVCVEPQPAAWDTRPFGPTSLAPHKRGIAAAQLSPAQLQALSSTVRWGYSWEVAPTDASGQAPGAASWATAGIEFVPMAWGSGAIGALAAGICQAATGPTLALLGFNEPNFPDQSNLTPDAAAELWPSLEEAATDAGVPVLVGPAMNFNDVDPIVWLDAFFAACTGCRVDAIAVHSYTCYWSYLSNHLDLYRKYNRPLWLTEFACADSVERKSAAGQMEYMEEVIPALEADPDVARYAWFSYDFQLGPAGTNEASLLSADGTLNELGRKYHSIGGNTTTPDWADQPGCHSGSNRSHSGGGGGAGANGASGELNPDKASGVVVTTAARVCTPLYILLVLWCGVAV